MEHTGDLVAAACFAVLNFSLALVVSRARPRTPASTTVVVLLTATGAAAMILAVAALGDPLAHVGAAVVGPPPLFSLQSLANYVTLVCLAFLPLVFPWRRLSGRGTRVALAAAILLMLPSAVARSFEALGEPLSSAARELADFGFPVLFLGAAPFGTLLLLHAFVTAESPLQRRQAQVFLAAYALKVATFVNTAPGLVANLVPHGGPAPSVSTWVATSYQGMTWALDALVIAAFLAVPIVLVTRRALGRARDGLGADLVVLSFLGGGLLFRPLGLSGTLEYQLIRPLLFAYGILLFQVLEVDVRERRWVIAAGALAAAGGIYVSIGQAAERGGLEAASGGALALMATVAALAVIGYLAMRALVGSEGAAESRRLLVYRAALDAHAREARRASSTDALRALRLELGISEREHDELAAQAGIGDAMKPGARFLDRYVIVRELGRGGHGTVVLARDERLGRDVAIKKVSDDQRRDAAALQRLRREMRLASALQHPNIVAVHDVEESGGETYLVLEHMSGGTLQQKLDGRGPRPEDEARGVARDVLAALAALHARGIIHRDVKPSNILFDERGTAKLGDFTIARSIVSGDTVGFTRDGIAAGTLAYMAPEQARGLPATFQSDLYGVAATLYAALSGRAPIPVDGLSDFEARTKVGREEPHLPLSGVSEGLNAWLRRGLAKNPRDRFASAAEMSAALGP